MRWLVAGARGMLGQDVVEILTASGHDVLAADRDEADITDPQAVDVVVAGQDVVLNCAAYTAVDAAEEQESVAFAVNALGPANLARAAARHGARMVQISTDYVFDGLATAPYAETAPLRPAGAYGRTKASGEWAVRAECPDALVVRTAYLYGAGGACFPATIARLLRERDTIDVVDDQVGQPTWTVDLARFVLALVEAGAPAGAYHGTSAGRASWWQFAREVATSIGADPERVRATTSETFVRPAPRPSYSVLGHAANERSGVPTIGDWQLRWRRAAPAVLAAPSARA